ncbi:MAG: hypothetical protein MI725_09030 [Pirellulales bacterium]|nr:hypothetical protein [Pirellulales bacterium]
MLEEIMSIVEETTELGFHRRENMVDRFGGSLVNIILGALILWVGQTTFRHAGQLASVDERFQGVEHQFDAVNGRHDALRQRLERTTSETHARTRSRFTREDGDKLATRIKELHEIQMILERQLTERVTNLQLKLISVEANDNSQQEIALLRGELERLRGQVAQQPVNYSHHPVGIGGVANSAPAHLPPVTQYR